MPKIAAGDTVFGVGLYDDPTWIDAEGIRLRGGATLTGAKPFVSDATVTELVDSHGTKT